MYLTSFFQCIFSSMFSIFLYFLLSYNWHTALCKFKVYSIMIWLAYITKWSPHLANVHHLIWIQNKRNRKKYFSLWWELRIYSLNNFCIKYTAVLIVLIMLYSTALVLIYLITKVCTSWLPSSSSPSPPAPASGNHKSDLFFYEVVCLLLKYNWPTTLC